jgi:8-oxo-dGTP pyrophosphatase MutT (NUDIX family)
VDSGDGFVAGADGTPRWGRHGAAGVLLVGHHDPENGLRVFLAKRSLVTHNGGTWALPGGALHRGESALQGALREFHEEVGEPPAHRVTGNHVAYDGSWSYTTVIAEALERWRPRHLSWETAATRWVRIAEVDHLELHPGFRAAWPELRAVVTSSAPPAGAGGAPG